MPKFKGLQVNVCIDGEPVEEFGTSTHSRSNTITTWIESKSDQAFTIRFEHDVPWDFSEGGTLKVVNGRVQKYDLRVDVYFDGNADRETGIILTDIGSIVDSADCRRRAIFENAVVEQQDGAVVYQTWIFRDAGVIDRMIGKLCLGPTKSGSEPDDQLELANTLQPTQIDNSTTKPHSKLGKITLIVRRRLVTRKRVYTDPSMLADRYQDDKRETEIDADDDDITHRVAGLSGDAVTAEPFTLYDSRPFDRGLGHYAKFDIYYRDRRRLAKLDLLSGSQLNNTKRKTTLKLLMPQKPSLNLLNEQRRLGKRKSRNSPEAFEEKIKKGSLRLHQDDTLEGFSHDGPRSTDKQSNDHSDDDSEDDKDCVSNNGARKMRKLTRRPYARDQVNEDRFVQLAETNRCYL